MEKSEENDKSLEEEAPKASLVSQICHPHRTRDERLGYLAPFYVIMSAFFVPILLEAGASDTFYSWVTALAGVTIAIGSPFMGAISDFSDYRKEAFLMGTIVGPVIGLLTLFVWESTLWLGGFIVVVTLTVYEMCLVFSYAYMPEVTKSPEEVNKLSAQALTLSNIATVLGLGLAFGFSVLTGDTIWSWKLIIFGTALWWLGFGVLSTQQLPHHVTSKTRPEGQGLIKTGVRQVWNSLIKMKRMWSVPEERGTVILLLSYLFYNDGMAAVIGSVGPFFTIQVELTPSQVTLVMLVAQLSGIFGALVLYKIAKRFNSTRLAARGVLFVWSCACPAVLLIGKKQMLPSLIMAFVIGCCIGGSIALFRSWFAQFVPQQCEAEYMGYYETMGTLTSWAGLVLVAVFFEETGSFGTATALLTPCFFGPALIISFFVPKRTRMGGEESDEEMLPHSATTFPGEHDPVVPGDE